MFIDWSIFVYMKKIIWIILALLILVALFFSIGLIKPSIQYKSKITVDRPVDKAFMVFIDASKMDHWLTGFKKIELVSGMPNFPGSYFNLILEMNGKEITLKEEVLDFRWNELFSVRIHHDLMSIENVNQFTPMEMKTEITGTYRVTGKNIFWRSVLVFARGKLKKRAQNDFDSLQKVIESN